jgi:hypothetical protein
LDSLTGKKQINQSTLNQPTQNPCIAMKLIATVTGVMAVAVVGKVGKKAINPKPQVLQ